MLNLSLTENYYEIVLADKTKLSIKRPTQAIQETLINLKTFIDSNGEEGSLETASKVVVDVFTRILNRNVDGKEFTAQQLSSEYGIEVMMMVINDYFTYWNEETKKMVDFQHSQQ